MHGFAVIQTALCVPPTDAWAIPNYSQMFNVQRCQVIIIGQRAVTNVRVNVIDIITRINALNSNKIAPLLSRDLVVGSRVNRLLRVSPQGFVSMYVIFFFTLITSLLQTFIVTYQLVFEQNHFQIIVHCFTLWCTSQSSRVEGEKCSLYNWYLFCSKLNRRMSRKHFFNSPIMSVFTCKLLCVHFWSDKMKQCENVGGNLAQTTRS